MKAENENNLISRRAMLSRTGSLLVATGAGELFTARKSEAAILPINREYIAYVHDLVVAALKKVAKASAYLAEKLDNVSNQVQHTEFHRNEASQKDIVAKRNESSVSRRSRDFHRAHGLRILPVDDIAAVADVELSDSERYMAWHRESFLRPLTRSGRNGQSYSDLNETELQFINEVHPVAGYEPWIPMTPYLLVDWGEEQRQNDFAFMYGGLLHHEIDSSETKKFMLNECSPIYYRWLWGGPGADKVPVLAIGYSHRASKKELMWTYNRPNLPAKTRQAAMDAYIQKVLNTKVPPLVTETVGTLSKPATT